MNRNHIKIVLPLGDHLATWLQKQLREQHTIVFCSVCYRAAGVSVDPDTNEITFELVKDKL